jgi:2-aminoethylphosphonate-pyruvate transaminase
MLRDYSLNEPEFLALTAEVRNTLLELVGGQETYVCVPLQGTGSAANEATLGTLVPRAGSGGAASSCSAAR